MRRHCTTALGESRLGQFRWVNSLQQLADGLTKPSAKDALAHTLARGVHALKYDPNFVAAKKVSAEAKEKEYLEYEKAAEELFDGQVFYVDKSELKEKQQLCMLPGCNKQRDSSTEGKSLLQSSPLLILTSFSARVWRRRMAEGSEVRTGIAGFRGDDSRGCE